jgi:Helicase HerA, central domain
MKFNIGVDIDLQKLTETRGLVQANSGGGKSYLLRKIAEEAAGKIPIIILDLDGEFGTLREVYPFLLIGKEGDISIEAKYADKIARTLLKLNTSAIIDLYEYNPKDRTLFVKKFCEALIDIGKELWHPTIIIIDEAHLFAPEKGQAQSSDAVINLLTRGRKRGFCTILATQRLSKLHKDAAAECNNKFIGRTGLDIDMKRASEELGFTSKQDMLSLRTLAEGEFFVFGPAISNQVKKIQVTKVRSTHPKSGQRIITSTPPSNEAIRQIVAQMKDIPQEAEKELQTVQFLQGEVNRLKSELRRCTLEKGDPEEVKRMNEILRLKNLQINNMIGKLKNLLTPFYHFRNEVNDEVMGLEKFISIVDAPININEIKLGPTATIMQSILKPFNRKEAIEKIYTNNSDLKLGKAQKLILAFLLLDPAKSRSTQQIGAMTGYSYTSGSFNNYLSELSVNGYILRTAKQIILTPDKIEDIRNVLDGEIDPSEFDIKHWLNKLGKGPKLIYDYLLQNQFESFSTEELAQVTGYQVSGSFNNYLSKLSALGLIKRQGGRTSIDPEIIIEDL